MRQHLFMFGLLGLLAWAAGCGSGNTAHSERTAATAASRPQSTDRAAQTRQVTLSITGMS